MTASELEENESPKSSRNDTKHNMLQSSIQTLTHQTIQTQNTFRMSKSNLNYNQKKQNNN